VRSSEKYRKYSSSICSFLHNRPRDFVEHTMSRYAEGQTFAKENVLLKDSGVFSVASAKEDGSMYTVRFNDNGMPSCECFDWKRHRMPCKHFCAVFSMIEGYGWDQLPSSYKDSPFFTLDECIVGDLKTTLHQQIYTCDLNVDNEDEFTTDVDLRSAVYHKAAACRELLTAIGNSTYLTDDADALDKLRVSLQATLASFSQSAAIDGGLLLNKSEPKRRKLSKCKSRAGGVKRKSRLTSSIPLPPEIHIVTTPAESCSQSTTENGGLKLNSPQRAKKRKQVECKKTRKSKVAKKCETQSAAPMPVLSEFRQATDMSGSCSTADKGSYGHSVLKV
jgi:hypothetical protein